MPLITVVPTPSKPDRATITGVLLQDPSTPRPVSGALLYLASLIAGPSGTPSVATLDRTSPLRTQTDRAGRFVFIDVPIQKYALVLDRITATYLLNNPKDNSDLLFEPKPNQILDVGDLVYPVLPGL